MKKPELYHDLRSYACQAVRMALAEKGVTWTGKIIDEAQCGDLKPSFLKSKSEQGVPLFEHDGVRLTDMLTICLYANNNFPGPRLVPTSAAQREAMEHWVRLFQQFPEREVSASSLAAKHSRRARGFLLHRQRAAEQLSARYPDHEEWYASFCDETKKALALAKDKKFVARAESRLAQMLDLLETSVDKTGWLAGDTISLADILWAVLLARLEYCGLKSLWTNGKRPRLEAYYERLRRRPNFSKAHVLRREPVFGTLGRFLKRHWGVSTLIVFGGVTGAIMLWLSVR